MKITVTMAKDGVVTSTEHIPLPEYPGSEEAEAQYYGDLCQQVLNHAGRGDEDTVTITFSGLLDEA